MSRILVNAANLHQGGAVQVASSAIEELALILSNDPCLARQITVFVSTEVANSLPTALIGDRIFRECRVLDVHGMGLFQGHLRQQYQGFDVCFTVLGPLYFNVKECYMLCGFAQAWIIYPKNQAYFMLKFTERLKSYLKFSLQAWFFRRNDRLVVELAHVKEQLVKRRLFDGDAIDVVENCLASVFLDRARWEGLDFDYSKVRKSRLTLGFVGRGYVHKNLGVLASVSEIMRNRYGITCNFFFTLDFCEMHTLGFDRVEGFYSVGSIRPAQCPAFYGNIDGLIFPSLLECFSVTPLEAMAMRRPVLASDRAFVRDLCGDDAYYFDPLDPGHIAGVVSAAFSDEGRHRLLQKVNSAYERVLRLPTAKDRGAKYVRLIQNAIAAVECRKRNS